MNRKPLREAADPGLAAEFSARLAQAGPLAGIAADTIAAALREGDLVELEAGEALIREGELATPEVYVLIDGVLAVRSGGSPLARLERTGDVVGEAAVVLSSRRTADVISEAATRAVAMPAAVLARPEFTDVAAGIRSALLRDDWIQY